MRKTRKDETTTRRQVMVRVTVVGLMAMVALLAGPISMAYAGGMGIGASPAFLCYTIAGASPGGNIDLTDEFFNASTNPLTDMKIGVARLVCTTVITGGGYTVPGVPPGVPIRNPLAPSEADADHLKCYDVRSSKGTHPLDVITIQDYFRP